MEKVLNRRWALQNPETKIHQVIHRHGLHMRGRDFLLNTNPSFGGGGVVEMDNKQRKHFYIVRDDLLHPLINGNKARKLDALLPLAEDCSVTDVVNYHPSTDYYSKRLTNWFFVESLFAV